mmetsp:Transcript_46741/g.91971  ORF Transcript_46741/g.91971 Transcript_46741/m.91971 type:complete len:209 (-) Transcript_46741:47-673(-)
MYDTSCPEPRGMTRSITSCSFSSSDISSLLSTKPTKSFPCILPSEACVMVDVMTEWRKRLLLCASFPPFSMSPLPLLIAKATICGRQSGLDSKMTISTPIGTVTCCNRSPSATCVSLTILPIGSSSFAMDLIPSVRVAIFLGDSTRRAAKALLMSISFAAKISCWLASKMDASWLVRASAIACRIASRSSLDRAHSCRPALRAATAWS